MISQKKIGVGVGGNQRSLRGLRKSRVQIIKVGLRCCNDGLRSVGEQEYIGNQGIRGHMPLEGRGVGGPNVGAAVAVTVIQPLSIAHKVALHIVGLII